MRFLFALLWALFTVMAYGQVQDVVPGSYTPGFFSVQNFIKNPNCFTNTRYITASGTGTIARNTTTPLRPFGDCSIGGSASGDKVTFSGKIFDKALKGQNCEARFTYAGDASKWKVYPASSGAMVSPSALQLESTIDGLGVTQSRPVSFSYPCGDTSAAIDIVFEATASSPLSFKATGVQSGLIVNGLSSLSTVGQWVNYGPMTITATTTAPTKATTREQDNVRCRIVAQDYECEFLYRASSATGSAIGSGVYIWSLPNGIAMDSSVPISSNVTGAFTYSGTHAIGSIGSGDLEYSSNGDTGTKCDLFATSTTTFQAACNFSGSVLQPSSTNASINNPDYSFKWTLKFRGAGLNGNYNAYSALDLPFSTDRSPLTWASSSSYTLSTLNTAPVGTFITYSYASSTNTRTQCTTAPTQTTLDMAANGIQLFTRAYNAASTCASPAIVAINIGTGYDDVSPTLYKSAGKSTPGSISHSIESAVEYGAFVQGFNPSSGVYLFDLAYTFQSTTTVHSLVFSDGTATSSGYLTVTGSKSKSSTFGSLTDMVTSLGSVLGVDIQAVHFGSGADCGTVCSTGNCTICSQVGTRITSVSFVSTGEYNLNGIDGTKYICGGSAETTQYSGLIHKRNLSSSTFAKMRTGNTSTSNGASVTAFCIGKP